MSEEAAEIYARGRRSGTSSAEAWAALEELAEEVNWDADEMVSEDNTSENQYRYNPQ